MRKLLFTAVLGGALSCVHAAASQRFYVTQLARTVDDSTVAPIKAHIDENLLIHGNGILLLGRQEQLEQAACYHIAKRQGNEMWLDSIEAASIYPGMTTPIQIRFSCPTNTVNVHFHVVLAKDGWAQCSVVGMDVDPYFSRHVAEGIVCGVNIDSIYIYRVRFRPAKAKL